MNLIFAERVQRLIRTLLEDDRQRMQAWFDHLKHWETDDFARSRSVLLHVQGEEMYMFRTSTDVRIFFTVDAARGSITIHDITERETILSFGSVAGAGKP